MYLHPEGIINGYGSRLVIEEGKRPADVPYLNTDRCINYDCVLEYLIATSFRDGIDICGIRSVSKVSEMFDKLLNDIITQVAADWSALRFNVPPIESINLYPIIVELNASSVAGRTIAIADYLDDFYVYADTRIDQPQITKGNEISIIAQEHFISLRSDSDVVTSSEMMTLTESIRMVWKDVMMGRVLSTVLEMDTDRTLIDVSTRLERFSGSEELVKFFKFFFGTVAHGEVIIFNSVLDMAMMRSLSFTDETPTQVEWICRALLD